MAAAGFYIFGIYPAWQVPFGRTFLMCLIAVTTISDDAPEILSRDKIFWIVGVIVMLAPICHALYISRDMIEITRATECPGSRFVLGGDLPLTVHLLLVPFSDIDVTDITNRCEAASFFSAAPLGLIIFFVAETF